MELTSLFPWLLFLHVMAAIVAFGPTFAFPLIGAMGGREPQHANFATRVSYAISKRLATPLALSMAVTGFALIIVGEIRLSERAYWWLGVSIVLYAVAIAYSLLVQSPKVARIIELTSTPPAPGASGPPPEVPALARSVKRGGQFLTIAVVVITALMVLKPVI
jgi:hypothetical protein